MSVFREDNTPDQHTEVAIQLIYENYVVNKSTFTYEDIYVEFENKWWDLFNYTLTDIQVDRAVKNACLALLQTGEYYVTQQGENTIYVPVDFERAHSRLPKRVKVVKSKGVKSKSLATAIRKVENDRRIRIPEVLVNKLLAAPGRSIIITRNSRNTVNIEVIGK